MNEPMDGRTRMWQASWTRMGMGRATPNKEQTKGARVAIKSSQPASPCPPFCPLHTVLIPGIVRAHDDGREEKGEKERARSERASLLVTRSPCVKSGRAVWADGFWGPRRSKGALGEGIEWPPKGHRSTG